MSVVIRVRKNSIPSLLQFPWVLFLIFPFAHWLGEKFMAIYVSLVFLLALNRFRQSQRWILDKRSVLGIFGALIFCCWTLFFYPGSILDSSSVDLFSALRRGVQFFVLVLMVNLLGNLDRNDFARYLKYLIVLICAITFFEAISVNLLHIPASVMPGFRSGYSYRVPAGSYLRPFGLVGNAPHNGTILVVVTWLFLGMNNFRPRTVLLWLMIVGSAVLVNASGQALMVFAMGILLYYFRFKPISLLALIPLLLIAHFVLAYEVLGPKMSYAYLDRMWEFFACAYEGLIYYVTPFEWAFGTMRHRHLSTRFLIEYDILWELTHLGVIFTVFFWGFVLSAKVRNRALKIGLLSAFVGSLHYSGMVVIFLQLPIAMLLTNWRRWDV